MGDTPYYAQTIAPRNHVSRDVVGARARPSPMILSTVPVACASRPPVSCQGRGVSLQRDACPAAAPRRSAVRPRPVSLRLVIGRPSRCASPHAHRGPPTALPLLPAPRLRPGHSAAARRSPVDRPVPCAVLPRELAGDLVAHWSRSGRVRSRAGTPRRAVITPAVDTVHAAVRPVPRGSFAHSRRGRAPRPSPSRTSHSRPTLTQARCRIPARANGAAAAAAARSDVPRAMPATVFCPSDRVPGAYTIFQDGRLKDVVNLQTSQLSAEEIVFVKAQLGDFGAPITPCELPSVADWDAPVVRSGPDPSDPSFLIQAPQVEPEAPTPENGRRIHECGLRKLMR